MPVILITGLSDMDLAVSAVKYNADDLILKPFPPKQILLSVERSITNKILKEQNEMLIQELQEKNARLEELNAQAHIRNSIIENDMEMASNLQECLYPKDYPEIDRINFSTRYCSVEKISGDFIYFHKFDEMRFSIIFADVSGHGVTAALFSAMVKSAIISMDFENRSAGKIVSSINDFLIKSQKKLSYNYLTMCYVFIDIEKQYLSYCNAGLPAPLLLKQNGDIIRLQPNGPFVGLFDFAEYKEDRVDFNPHDKAVFFTDGVYEDSQNYNIKKGYEMVYNIISEHAHRNIDEIISELYNHMDRGKDKSDDSTYLGIQFL
ncbi:MAG: PP2C family protein-serine/threonine phosphatase, partial [Spirochaetota bacterium]